MKPRAAALAIGLSGLAATAAAAAGPLASPAADSMGLSGAEAIASYRLSARLDAEKHQVHGAEHLTWRNTSRGAVTELRFHLYLNAYRNTSSTWALEVGAEGLAGLAGDEWGWIEVEHVRDAAGRELAPRLEYLAPDDGNADDRTVARLPLTEPVPPGGSLELDLEFLAQLPRLRDRTGFEERFHLVGQWFPKVGVLAADGTWRCHQFHRDSEFFADFGDYDVDLTVPRGFVVGATGRRIAEQAHGEREIELRYRQAAVHDFAWSAWPGFVERHRRLALPDLPPVEVRLLLRRETLHHAERLFAVLAAGLERFGRWFGPYPYPELTVVDPPWGAEIAGGMEYPTLITLGTRVLSPATSGEPESLVLHELAHQWFYGLVANDEPEEAFLDEGLATYAAARAQAEAYPFPAATVWRWGMPWTLPAPRLDPRRELLAAYFDDPTSDPIARAAWGFLDGAAYGRLAYEKMALTLFTLERLVGAEPVHAGLALYARRFRFGHPRAADLEGCLAATAGEPVHAFFEQLVRGSDVLDYAIDEATTRRRTAPAGVVGDGEARHELAASDEPPPGYESVVVVRRRGGVRLPVTTELVFAHGLPLRLTWDGADRWVRYRVTGPRLVSATVDPDRALLLDANPLDNSRRVEPDRAASRAWSQRLRFWIQQLFATAADLS